MRCIDRLAVCLVLAVVTGLANAQADDLASYFGFSDVEIVKIGRNAGPIIAADMNGDGRDDLIVVNNRASRLEIHFQKANASPDDEVTPPRRINEFPEHWRFRRQMVPVSHRVSAMLATDFDRDGLMDLIYAGRPLEIVFMRQSQPGTFEVTRAHRVKNLAATRTGFALADVLGDGRDELMALVDGEIHIWPLEGDGDALGDRVRLTTGEAMVAFIVEDFTGDGRTDIVGIIPDDSSPIRMWPGRYVNGTAAVGAQRRFEMPPLLEATPVRLPGEAAARLAVIERPTKRLVVKEVITEQIASSGDRPASMQVYSFTDGSNRKRKHLVTDVDGDGRLDLLATDTSANAVVVYQQGDQGLRAGRVHPSLADLTGIAAGSIDGNSSAEVFVMSEDEAVVGRSDVTGNKLPFPRPLGITEGHEPVALAFVTLAAGPRVAVVVKDGRDHVLELIDAAGNRESFELGSISRSPEVIVDLDADQDGRTDLLLFTPDKPMTMVRATDTGFEVLDSDAMGQFGLVKAATADNTAVFDIDGDGRDELLLADNNYVRALRYDESPGGGTSPGWQVVNQINARDGGSKLVAITVLDGRIVAADQENARLVMMDRQDGSYAERESLFVEGFDFDAIHAGAFSGDGAPNILAVGDDGFAVIRLSGERIALEDRNIWRSDDERRFQHELQAGDVNGDGYMDLVSLDAGEQMCEIFSFSEAERMLFATSFQVFESRMFSGGDARQFEPSQIVITDLTGDGAADIALLAHDRVLLYPQMTQDNR